MGTKDVKDAQRRRSAESTKQGSQGLTKTEGAIMEPAWVFTKSSAYMLQLLAWGLEGNPDHRSEGISDSLFVFIELHFFPNPLPSSSLLFYPPCPHAPNLLWISCPFLLPKWTLVCLLGSSSLPRLNKQLLKLFFTDLKHEKILQFSQGLSIALPTQNSEKIQSELEN